MKPLFLILTLAIVLCCTGMSKAAQGDTTSVVTLDGYRYYTKGDMSSDSTYLFPSAAKKYARIIMKVKLSCPCGTLKGEWDYDVHFNVRRKTGKADPATEDIEIARFITPYWKNRVADWNYTWQWDVTDYASLLRDSVRLYTYYSGYSQSTAFKVWFEFIEGTPPYEVLSVQRLWQQSSQYGNPAAPINDKFANMKFARAAGSEQTRLRILLTGHGFGGTDNAAEFSDHTHAVWINGTKRYDHRIWQGDCGANPVFPQDGTWAYARGGWCPGEEVPYWDWDISTAAREKDTTVIDYKFQNYTNADLSKPASYSSAAQILHATKYAFTNDASLQEIKAPNNERPYWRMNPICGSPVVAVRNNGSATLTSVTIEYGVRGESMKSFTYKGSIAPMQTSDITLPPYDFVPSFKDTQRTFDVRITKVNDAADEYPLFNTASSTFGVPPMYPGDIAVRFQTNRLANQQGYFWTLTDSDGKEVAKRSAGTLSDNTMYSDSLTLADGCYEFRFVNPSSIGLSWWASQGQVGNGALSFSSRGKTVQQFEGDCGLGITHQFRVGAVPTIQAKRDTVGFGVLAVNDSSQRVIEIRAMNRAGLDISSISISSLNAAKAYSIVSIDPPIPTGGSVSLKNPNGTSDVIRVTVQFKADKTGRRTASLSVGSNDIFDPTYRIPLLGGAEPIVSVEENPAENLAIEVAPMPVSGLSTVTVHAQQSSAVRCVLINTLGQEVRTVFDGTMSGDTQSVALDASSLPTGTYRLVLRSGNASVQHPFVVVR